MLPCRLVARGRGPAQSPVRALSLSAFAVEFHLDLRCLSPNMDASATCTAYMSAQGYLLHVCHHFEAPADDLLRRPCSFAEEWNEV